MINLQLDKPLVFFDIEATGLHVIRDRIIQLGMIKYVPGKQEGEEMNLLINPGPVLISEEAYQVHGISAADLRNKPTFDQLAQKIFDFIGDADLAGYNSDRFDVPMLMEEFARSGIDFSLENRKTIDVQKIFYKMEPRTLVAAYKFYCGKTLDMAHDALADVRATAEVLSGQIKKYEDVDYDGPDGVIAKPIRNDVATLSAFTTNKQSLDATQRLKYNAQGEIVFNFGKYMGKPVGKTLFLDRNYYDWIQNKEFSVQVKQLTKKLFKEYADSQKA